MKKIIPLAFLLFYLTNCISQNNISLNENFVFQNGDEEISFEILTGNKYLEVNIPTKTKFKFENVEPKTASLSGKTIRFLNEKETKENELLIEMSPKKEDLEDGKLIIRLSYKSKGEFKIFKLNIPVKTE